MEKRTVNGKELSVIQEQLTRPFNEFEVEHTDSGKPFISSDKLKSRLDDTIGIFNYDFICEDSELVKTDSSYAYVTHGRLIIFDDMGIKVCEKRSIGACNIKMKKGDELHAASLEDNVKTAQTSAFKVCCKMLCIGQSQLQEEKRSQKEKEELERVARDAYSSYAGSQVPQQSGWKESDSQPCVQQYGAGMIQLYNVKIVAPVTERGAMGYCVPVVMEDGTRADLMVWKSNAMEGLRSAGFTTLQSFLDTCIIGSRKSLYGKPNIYRGSLQLEFVRL